MNFPTRFGRVPNSGRCQLLAIAVIIFGRFSESEATPLRRTLEEEPEVNLWTWAQLGVVVVLIIAMAVHPSQAEGAEADDVSSDEDVTDDHGGVTNGVPNKAIEFGAAGAGTGESWQCGLCHQVHTGEYIYCPLFDTEVHCPNCDEIHDPGPNCSFYQHPADHSMPSGTGNDVPLASADSSDDDAYYEALSEPTSPPTQSACMAETKSEWERIAASRDLPPPESAVDPFRPRRWSELSQYKPFRRTLRSHSTWGLVSCATGNS